MCDIVLVDTIYNVLPTVVDTSIVDTETIESGPRPDTRHVHGVVFNRILLREKALYDMQFSIPGGRVSDLL